MGKAPSKKYKPGIGHQEKTPMNEGKKNKYGVPTYNQPFAEEVAQFEDELKLWKDMEAHYGGGKGKALVMDSTIPTHDGLYAATYVDLKKLSQNFPKMTKHPGKITINTGGIPLTLSNKIHALFGPKLKQMIDQDVPDHLLIKFEFDYSVEYHDCVMYISLTAQKHEVLVQKMKFTSEALEYGTSVAYQIIDNVKYLVHEFEKKYPKKVTATMQITSFKKGDLIALFGGSGITGMVMDADSGVPSLKFDYEGLKSPTVPGKEIPVIADVFKDLKDHMIKMQSGAMAVEAKELQHAKQVVVPKVAPVAKTEIEALVDELGTLNAKLVELEVKAMQARVEEIRKHLLQSIPPELDGQAVSIPGTEYVVNFAANAKQYKLKDKPALVDKLGLSTFVELATIKVTDLSKVLSENEMNQYGETTPTGARVMKVIEIPS